jgi:hypothetical protein
MITIERDNVRVAECCYHLWKVRTFDHDQSSRFYDRDNETLLVIFGGCSEFI